MTSEVYRRASHIISVLFVDDDADTLFAYRLLATDEGMRVEVAQDAYAALTLADLLLPDVIVLDIGLRGVDAVDGFEVVRRLRANMRTRGIPIVIVSGYDSAHDLAAVRASGCDGHLVKPCAADTLLGLVRDLAMNRKLQADALRAQEESRVRTA